MTAIAILRPVMVTLVEGHRKPRKFYSITWRSEGRKDECAGLHYRLQSAQDMARECGAREIVVEDADVQDASPAPRLADQSYEDVQELRREGGA